MTLFSLGKEPHCSSFFNVASLASESLLKLSRVLGAGVLTFAMFLFMASLIAPEELPPGDIESVGNVTITRTIRDERSEQRERLRPVEPEQEKLPPPPPVVQQNTSLDRSDGTAFDFPTGFESDGFDPNVLPSDRQATPLVRIPPQYPQRALTNGIEGWVLVEFTINKAGGVENVRVVDAEPKNTFDRSAVRAIERWKYQPKVVDGKPVAQTNMRELIRFQFEE